MHSDIGVRQSVDDFLSKQYGDRLVTLQNQKCERVKSERSLIGFVYEELLCVPFFAFL